MLAPHELGTRTGHEKIMRFRMGLEAAKAREERMQFPLPVPTAVITASRNRRAGTRGKMRRT